MASETMRVARVIDQHSVAINRGADAGISVGDRLRISDDVVDPETGEVIGRYPDLGVQVTEVFPRFCVAVTYGKSVGSTAAVTVNVGDPVRAG